MQLLWFLDSSNPGRHSQATPPLGVSLQMWAQPWSLFMQLMPSVKQERNKSISILSNPVCRQQSQFNTSTQTKPPTLGRLCRVGTRSFSLQRGKEASLLQSQCPQGFSFCDLFCAQVLWLQGQRATSTDLYSTCSHFILLGVHKTSSFLL